MRRRRSFQSLLGAALLAALTSTARGQSPAGPVAQDVADDSPQARAGRLFTEGLEHVEAEDYQAALDAFQEAHALEPHPHVLFNIARTLERLYRLEDAVSAYQRYLSTAGEEISEDRRVQVEKRLTFLQAALKAQTPPEPPPTPSCHPTPTQRPPDEKMGILEVSEQHMDEITLRSLTPEEPAPVPRWTTSKIAGIAMAGVGTVLAGSAVGVFVRNDRRHDSWQTERDQLQDAPPDTPGLEAARADNNDELQKIQRTDTTTWILGASATALLAASAFTYFFEFPQERTRVGLARGSLHLETIW